MIASSEVYEPAAAINAFHEWFAQTSRKAYIMGPMVASGTDASKKEKKQSAKSAEIETFLDKVYKTHGEKSLVYV